MSTTPSSQTVAAAQQAQQQQRQPEFSFIHVLQLVQPVPRTSPYKLPSLTPGQILPSRLAKTKAPFPVAPPTNLDALYKLASGQRDPEEVRREKNRKKKERKMASKARREAGEAEADEADAEGKEGEAEAEKQEGPVYGLPLDVPQDFFTLFEAHYHRIHAVACQQREQAWEATRPPGDDVQKPVWGDVVLHSSIVKRGGKRESGRGAFVKNEKSGKVDFHWAL
ncbi:hypothetical protein JCM10213_000060 [Rhodosporidiobolus nylandii]